jgi:hypothetical protein
MATPPTPSRRRARIRTPLLAALVAAAVSALVTLLVATSVGPRAAGAQPGQQAELRAERLTVVWPDGRPRIVLGEVAVGELAGTGLVVYDADGRTPRLAQGMTTGGQSGLVVFDSAGASRLELATGWDGRDDGSVNLTGRAADGTPRFELSFDPTAPGEGLNLLRLRDAHGQARAVIVTLPDGGVAINLGDGGERLRAQVRVGASGAPEFRLLDDQETVIWRAP